MSAHKPRSGSLAFYPRVRAKQERQNFSSFTNVEAKDGAKAINFAGYKAGMIHVFAKNAYDKSVSFGQETMIPATVVECPPVKVIGARLYEQTHYGLKVIDEVTTDKFDKNLRSKIKSFKQKGKKKIKAKHEEKYTTFEDLEKRKQETAKVVLLAQAQPSLTGAGKKISDVFEINIAGSVEQQFAFAKEKLGKDLKVSDVLKAQEFVDVKAVDKGKGFQGVVRRFGVKVHRPKAKKHRYVGSIGPWHPATVMWTVARPGQMGYQVRTEFNKRLLAIDTKPELVNPSKGFSKYGAVKSEFVVIAGSVPGPAKRIIALRHAIRSNDQNIAKYTDIKLPGANQ